MVFCRVVVVQERVCVQNATPEVAKHPRANSESSGDKEAGRSRKGEVSESIVSGKTGSRVLERRMVITERRG